MTFGFREERDKLKSGMLPMLRRQPRVFSFFFFFFFFFSLRYFFHGEGVLVV